MTSQTRDELLASGRRAMRKNGCGSVLVAPDHTGEDNYHNCGGGPRHTGNHGCGCGYAWSDGAPRLHGNVWSTDEVIVIAPFTG